MEHLFKCLLFIKYHERKICQHQELTRIISNAKNTAKAAPNAKSRNFGWKKGVVSAVILNRPFQEWTTTKNTSIFLLTHLEDKSRQKHWNSHQMIVFSKENSFNLTILWNVVEPQNRQIYHTHPVDTKR